MRGGRSRIPRRARFRIRSRESNISAPSSLRGIGMKVTGIMRILLRTGLSRRALSIASAVCVALAIASLSAPSANAGDAQHASDAQHDADVTIAPQPSSPDSPPPTEPADYRNDNYRSPVPLTLKGATVLSDSDAMKFWDEKSAIFIDVYPHPPKPPNLPAGTLWRETTHQSIENANWLPNVGYGVLSPASADYFQRNLEMLTQGDKTKRLIFFCLRDCWMSWNAAKRALSYGYTNVDWYPDGTDGWQENGGDIKEVRPLP